MTTTSNAIQPTETTVQPQENCKPGYKKTKLGWIPEDWDIRSMDNLVTLIPPKPLLKAETGFSFIAMTHIFKNGPMTRKESHKYQKDQKGLTSFKESQIIVAKTTPCKSPLLAFQEHQKLNLS